MDEATGQTGHAAAAELLAILRTRDLTLATAESLTGGALADAVSSVPGASAGFVGGVVAYATVVKQGVLGVSADTLATHGAVSAECAAEMAGGVRSLLGADVGLSTTGVAGPESQEGKPVGRVHVAVAGPLGTRTVELRLSGDRQQIRARTVALALSTVLDTLREPDV